MVQSVASPTLPGLSVKLPSCLLTKKVRQEGQDQMREPQLTPQASIPAGEPCVLGAVGKRSSP